MNKRGKQIAIMFILSVNTLIDFAKGYYYVYRMFMDWKTGVIEGEHFCHDVFYTYLGRDWPSAAQLMLEEFSKKYNVEFPGDNDE